MILNQNTKIEEQVLLTQQEVAERLKVPMTWIYRQVSMGRLRCHKVGKYSRFYWSEILEDLEKMKKINTKVGDVNGARLD